LGFCKGRRNRKETTIKCLFLVVGKCTQNYGDKIPIVDLIERIGKGTEERQADILEQNLRAYTSKDFISGMYIWQFCDCRVTEATGWLLNRAGTQNSKGIVDVYRRPKLAYNIAKQFFDTD
jgi:hypothetical protein